MTPASADRVRWLVLVLVSVIIAVAGQPVPSVAAASIVCTLAGAAAQQVRSARRLRAELRAPRRERAVP